MPQDARNSVPIWIGVVLCVCNFRSGVELWCFVVRCWRCGVALMPCVRGCVLSVRCCQKNAVLVEVRRCSQMEAGLWSVWASDLLGSGGACGVPVCIKSSCFLFSFDFVPSVLVLPAKREATESPTGSETGHTMFRLHSSRTPVWRSHRPWKGPREATRTGTYHDLSARRDKVMCVQNPL